MNSTWLVFLDNLLFPLDLEILILNLLFETFLYKFKLHCVLVCHLVSPSLKVNLCPISSLTVKGSVHKLPSQLEFLSILKPFLYSGFSSGIHSHPHEVITSWSDVFASAYIFALTVPSPEPYPQSPLMLSSLELSAGIIKTLDWKSLLYPSIVVLSERLSFPHFPHPVEFVDTGSSMLDLLLLSHRLFLW